MQTLTFKTNINCGGCIAKVTPYLQAHDAITHWAVDTQNPDKILSVSGNITQDFVCELIQKAGFTAQPQASTLPTKQQGFWDDKQVWKRASANTLNCLIGCSIGDFGMIIYLQANGIHVAMWLMMTLAIVSGLITSILLETVLLRYKEKLTWAQSIQTALGMSLISMIAMELAMNITDFMITGGKADMHSPTYWGAFGVALIAGFFAPLPYNYFKLKKYNKACH